jgi:hypothetical protein
VPKLYFQIASMKKLDAFALQARAIVGLVPSKAWAAIKYCILLVILPQ